jgi:uncharacterized protein (DUF885 family)
MFSYRPAVLLMLGLALSACGQEPDVTAPAQRSIEAIADDYLEAMLRRYPTMGTYYAIPGARHDNLFDNSLAAGDAWDRKQDAWIAELDAVSAPTEIGSRDWTTYGILYEEIASSIATRVCRSELWYASTATAWHTDLPFVFDLQPLETPELREQAIVRLGKVPAYIDTEIDNLRHGLELGYSAPRVTVEDVPGEIRALLAGDNPFVNMIQRVDDAEFEVRVRAVFDKQIAPAIERFAAFIEGEYLERARAEIALAANPDGAECYPALVRSFTTIAPPADKIHTVGLEQIEAIRAEMREIIDEHFGGEDVSAFLRRINNDPEFTYRDEDAVLQHSLDTLDAVRDRMSEAFNLLPKADVLIKPYPEFRGTATGEYQSSSEDGTRPGIFYIPVTNPQHRSRAGQQTFLHHETYPGHHLQGAIALELGDRVHALARYLWNAGYGEGWALYSERLADEMGLYSEPLDRLGMLSDQAARASRLVIDTGALPAGTTRLEVEWPSAALATMTLIDTPGLDDETGGGDVSADAVVVLMRYRHAADAAFLDAFSGSRAAAPTAASAIAVVSRSDELGDGGPNTPEIAQRAADRVGADPRIGPLCSTVLPVAGLLGEAGATITEAEVEVLRSVARLGLDERSRALSSVDRFRAAAVTGSSPRDRHGLLVRLGMAGIRIAVAALADREVSGAADLGPLLVHRSGVPRLRAELEGRFAARSEALRAVSAIADLRDIAAGSDEIDRALERIEGGADELVALRLADLLAAGIPGIGADDAAALKRLLGAGDPAARLGVPTASRAAAAAAAARWRGVEADPIAERELVEAARLAARLAEGIHARLS